MAVVVVVIVAVVVAEVSSSASFALRRASRMALRPSVSRPRSRQSSTILAFVVFARFVSRRVVRASGPVSILIGAGAARAETSA